MQVRGAIVDVRSEENRELGKKKDERRKEGEKK